jgi:hypothetical protein
MAPATVMLKLTQEAYWEWRELARVVQDAYDAWSRASMSDSAEAFDEYMDLLDLEERVALEYAELVGRLSG